MSKPASFRKIFNILMLAGMIAAGSCSASGRKTEPPEKTGLAPEECIVWSHNDSMAMEVVHMANAYISDGRPDKAGVLFRHAAAMQHDLPGIAMHAGQLTDDTIRAKRYFHLEIRQDQRILKSRLPDCRKYEFLVTMYRCYRLLDEQQKADSILKHYRKINNRATPSDRVMRGAWMIY